MKFYILSFLLVSFANIIKSQPVITSFSPTAAPAGSQIVINGAGFSNTSANNIVYFGAVKAVVSSSIINAITVIVPVGATYNPLSVTTGNLTAISSNCFIPTFSGGDSNFT
ncbi:MAG: IPT/TIG domain-containing protein, partial [Sphingobacteriales bacterium]